MRIIVVLFFSLIINVSCSKNEEERGIELSENEKLTSKTWVYESFKFLDSSNNIKNYSSKVFEEKVNEIYKNLSITFNENGRGLIKSPSVNKKFSWELLENKLKMIVPNPTEITDDIFNEIISVNSKLEITMTQEFVLFIDGNEVNARGIQNFK